MLDQIQQDSNDDNSPSTEAKKIIRIRTALNGPWVEVSLRYRGTLWAHVEDDERKFRVQWKDVHPDDKFDFQ